MWHLSDGSEQNDGIWVILRRPWSDVFSIANYGHQAADISLHCYELPCQLFGPTTEAAFISVFTKLAVGGSVPQCFCFTEGCSPQSNVKHGVCAHRPQFEFPTQIADLQFAVAIHQHHHTWRHPWTQPLGAKIVKLPRTPPSVSTQIWAGT